MAFISLQEAQQWFKGDRLVFTAVQVELEATAMEIVTSAVRVRYDVSTWVDGASTPGLIRKIVSLLHGAWYFNSVAGESLQMEYGKTYGDKLESLAMLLLAGIAGGSTPLDDLEPTISATEIAFYPTDDSTTAGDTPRVFSMNTTTVVF